MVCFYLDQLSFSEIVWLSHYDRAYTSPTITRNLLEYVRLLTVLKLSDYNCKEGRNIIAFLHDIHEAFDRTTWYRIAVDGYVYHNEDVAWKQAPT